MSDLIDRQTVLDAIEKNAYRHTYIGQIMDIIKSLPSAQPYTEAEIQKMQDLEQAQLDKAYELGRQSAQPEIIRCKDCRYYDGYDCERLGLQLVEADEFCAWAERRTDG